MDIKIYLTNLAKYNEGYLVGKWLDLGELSEEELDKEIKEILGNDEEFFITDYEAPFKIDEYDNVHDLRDFAEQANKMDDYDAARYCFLVEQGNTKEEALEHYDNVTAYESDSFEDLAKQFVDEGLYGEIPEALQYYIDYEKIGNDLSFDYTEFEYNNTTYFMSNNW